MSIAELLSWNAAIIAFVMLVLWVISVQLRDTSIVDIFWGVGFVLIAWVSFALGNREFRSILLVVLTSAWGLRLAGYLAWRNHGKGEDPRYLAMRNHHGKSFWWVSLLTVFGLQGAVMWLVSLPVQVGQLTDWSSPLLLAVGSVCWLIGFVFESVGDYQLARFKSRKENAGRVMDQGLWRYTRHPNYFGNAMIWWGIFLVAVAPSTVWLAVSPIVMTFLLIKVSGVALLEKSLAPRSQEYRDYIQRTSSFLPWPPKRA